jgi:hypothetical protein
MSDANDRRPKGKGRNFTVNIRMSREEIEAARQLGGGNISQGFRQAIRYAVDRDMRPVTLTVLLRSATVLAQELEERCKQFKSDAMSRARRASSSSPMP